MVSSEFNNKPAAHLRLDIVPSVVMAPLQGDKRGQVRQVRQVRQVQFNMTHRE